jgi:hypothetical protein
MTLQPGVGGIQVLLDVDKLRLCGISEQRVENRLARELRENLPTGTFWAISVTWPGKILRKGEGWLDKAFKTGLTEEDQARLPAIVPWDQLVRA